MIVIMGYSLLRMNNQSVRSISVLHNKTIGIIDAITNDMIPYSNTSSQIFQHVESTVQSSCFIVHNGLPERSTEFKSNDIFFIMKNLKIMSEAHLYSD